MFEYNEIIAIICKFKSSFIKQIKILYALLFRLHTYNSVEINKFDEHWDLNSGSALSRNRRSSFVIAFILLEFTKAKHNSRALLK